ncbi:MULTISPECIES: uroporphyrinogen-III synthase [Rhodopseudomonas]|uniref:Uroporphyrinogen-III synthase n=1 Tax=Rhodopseudomonas palustris TaxID=1076 RepID=A0A0D7F1X8_RHOPL|nr:MULTISPECIES: uroporphyrinogen-III synthase [Rhodopseudomonas]KIZ47118.1 uroporphyrinogen III synthase [Rhodopseudomonas palustris]MDF3811393.1 uroporphyrinogen-III synthase [Rhodopseudomonas sp. BAL398]WOK16310.1 uroporphyrinogen-III synthase [Rhodopseudomonas sp. BAL398]
MAMLVTRPQPDGDATAAALRAKGYQVLLAPMLRFEPVPFQDDPETDYSGVIVTSANALRAIEGQAILARLLKLPLFAVGKHTAQAARDAGFGKLIVAKGDAAALRDSVVSSMRARKLKKSGTLLYLAAADLSRDLAGELRQDGFNVTMQITYKMAPVPNLPPDVCEAFAAQGIEAVLHYSRRSAQCFVDATRASGIEISALAIPQCCLSESVSDVVRQAGATQVTVARKPDESALFEALDRALSPLSR